MKPRFSYSNPCFLFFPAAALILGALSLHTGIYFLSSLTVIMAWLAIALSSSSIPFLQPNRKILPIVAILFIPFWLAGIDSPFHWDAAQTAARSALFWNTGILDRCSIFYITLSPFIALAPRTTVAAHLFTMLLGALTLLMIGFAARGIAGRKWGLRAALFAAVVSPVYYLYRNVLPDTILVFLWSATLALIFAWVRSKNPWTMIGIIVLAALTTASKELGGLIVFPVITALLLASPRRSWPMTAVLSAIIIAICGRIAVLSLKHYAHQHHIDSYLQPMIDSDRGLTFLFNSAATYPWIGAIKPLVRHHLIFWAHSGLIVPIAFALWRPLTARATRALLIAGITAQIAWVIASSFGRLEDAFTYPVFNGNLRGWYLVPFAAFAALLAVMWAMRQVVLKIDRQTIILLSAILPGALALLCFAKMWPDANGNPVAFLAWNYPLVLLIGGILLAVQGMRRIRARGACSISPGVLRYGLFAVMLTCMSMLINTLDTSLELRTVDLAYERAYAALQKQPIRTVYSHWPFFWESKDYPGMNNGSLAWQSDGWRVLNVRELGASSAQPEQASLLLWDEYRGYSLPLENLRRFGKPNMAIPAFIWHPGLFHPFPRIKHHDAIVVRKID